MAQTFYDVFLFEQKTDVMGKLVGELIDKTHEFLQPNPGKIISY